AKFFGIRDFNAPSPSPPRRVPETSVTLCRHLAVAAPTQTDQVVQVVRPTLGQRHLMVNLGSRPTTILTGWMVPEVAPPDLPPTMVVTPRRGARAGLVGPSLKFLQVPGAVALPGHGQGRAAGAGTDPGGSFGHGAPFFG